MRSQVLSLYRDSLRVLRKLPIPAVRKKMAYNFRELFSIYQNAGIEKTTELLEDGRHDLSVLKEILQGRRDNVYALFKTFENLNNAAEPGLTEADVEKQIISI